MFHTLDMKMLPEDLLIIIFDLFSPFGPPRTLSVQPLQNYSAV